MIKIVNTYYKLPVRVKAGVWYMVSNLLQKMTAFLLIPLMTRLLTIEDYGIYMLYVSWFVIFEIIATFRLYSNNFVAGLIKNDKDNSNYIATIQISSWLITTFFMITGMMFYEELKGFVELNERYLFLMGISFFSTSVIGEWTARKRVSLEYRIMIKITCLYSVMTPLISAFFANISVTPLVTFLTVKTGLELFIAVPLFASNINWGNFHFIVAYFKEAIKLNIPLLPYYLSMTALNISDRIMIKNIYGEVEVAIYSVAYSFSMALFFISAAFTQTLQPWIFSRMKYKKSDNRSDVISYSAGAISIINIVFMLMLPEILQSVVPNEYYASLYVMPPLIFSVIIMFVYQQMLNVHFFYNKSMVVFMSSVIAAMTNISLNYFLLPSYGYQIAAYTTLISYMFILMIYWMTMKKISGDNKFDYCSIFNNRNLILMIVFDFILISIADYLYYSTVLRYAFLAISLIIFVFNLNKILKLKRLLSNE